MERRPESADAAAPTLLVTGGSGFVGKHLLRALAERWPEARLHATARDRSPNESPADCRWETLDITDAEGVAALVKSLKPHAIVHLAAQSHVPTSFEDPAGTWRVNLDGTLNLLEALRQYSPSTRLLQVGSSDMYGGTFREGQAVTENSPLLPLNPYAASKAAADLAAYQYSQSAGLAVIRLRPFNHTGPGQSERFVLPAFASQIARIERGDQPPVLETGNLDAERDFLDVDDVVAAYLSLLALPREKYQGQAYNIASGAPVSIRFLLERLVSLSTRHIDTRLDPARQRPVDIARVAADTSSIHRATAWRPVRSTDDMLRRLLDDCRQRMAG